MISLVVFSVILSSAYAAPQTIAGTPEVPAGPAFFLTSPLMAPTVFALKPPALPEIPATTAAPVTEPTTAPAASTAAPVAAAAAAAVVTASEAPAASPAEDGIVVRSSASDVLRPVPALPTDVANAYVESNLRLAQAYSEARSQIAASSKKVADEALVEVMARATLASKEKANIVAAPVASTEAATTQPAPAAAAAAVAAPAPALANSGLVLPPSMVPISFPISLFPTVNNAA